MALLPISSSLYALFVPPHFRHFPFSLSHLCRICPLCSGQGKGKHIEEGRELVSLQVVALLQGFRAVTESPKTG